MRPVIGTVLACALCVLPVGPGLVDRASAQDASRPADTNPVVIYTRQPGAQIGAAAAELVQRARAQGRLRVIAGLNVTMRPEHLISPAQASQQLQVLRAAQNAVADRVLNRTTGDDIVRFDFIPYISMWVDAAQVGRLIADPQVVVVQEDVPSRPLDTVSIPLIHAPDLWMKSIKGNGRTVAILDTGVDKTHRVLVGKVKSEACYSSNNGKTGVSYCPGGATHSTATGSGTYCPISIPECKHGTHVASIAAALQTSSEIGVAPSANIIAIQVFTKLTTAALCKPDPAPCARTYDTDWIQGLQRVYALRTTFSIAAANLSLGRGLFPGTCDGTSPAATTAIKNLRNAGIAVLVASGNDYSTGSIAFPACISQAIAIGASTKPPDEDLANFSNDNDLVKLLAPGVNIYAAVPPDKFEVMSGTSMATPAVTGSYALLKQAKPNASVSTILSSLICTAKIIPLPPDGEPRIDLIGAYNRLLLLPQAKRSWSFTKVSEGYDWTPQTGNWVVQSGLYRETVIKDQFLAGSSTDNCNSSLQVDASMERVDPNETKTNIYSNAGIVIKAKIDYSANKYVSGYFIGYNNCPADKTGTCGAGKPTEPGQTFIFRLDKYSFANNTGGFKILCQGHALSKPKSFNALKIVSRGSSHVMYLNGKVGCKATDATYAVGPVMAVVAYGEKSGGAFSMNSFSTTSLQTASSPAAQDALGEEAEDVPVMDPEAYAPKSIPAGMSVLGSRPQKNYAKAGPGR